MDEEKTLDLLRRIRHDFGNHLQVMLGYIDLGNPAQARQYIINMVNEMAAERVIFERTDPEIALYLYDQLLLSRDLRVILRYDEIQLKSKQMLIENNEPLHSLEQLLGRCENEDRDEDLVVYLEIYETADGVDLLYSCESMEEGSIVIEVRK